MKKIILVLVVYIFSFGIEINAQDLISGGTNSWVFHTPDDGRTILSITPKINGVWDFGKETVFQNDGIVKIQQLTVGIGGTSMLGDLAFEGGNDWVLHHPGTVQGSLHFAPKINGQWNWNQQIYFTKDADVIVDGKIGIGSRNPDEKLTVKGKIHAEEVRVDLNVPADYVFQHYYTGFSALKETYKMPTLEEVEAFAKKHHHLPAIPSAKQIQKDGLHLKEMTNLLLQKIEELTLYTIEQQKSIKAQEKRIKDLEKVIKN
ncbi:tail fiber protein [uncultured Polaribacter sp.]|uniref:tail fiber protein n=1 Tax=uncultured Polaribacter sp. TaxID=174711 RepID=UPI002639B07B|nr:tail fiber protein [uncultured Polaribacter sp.]